MIVATNYGDQLVVCQPVYNGAVNEISCIVLDKMIGLRNCE